VCIHTYIHASGSSLDFEKKTNYPTSYKQQVAAGLRPLGPRVETDKSYGDEDGNAWNKLVNDWHAR